jgi:hypothetical protein
MARPFGSHPETGLRTNWSCPAAPVEQLHYCFAGTVAGLDTQAVLDTPAVTLKARGETHFTGHIPGIPANCSNPLFLIRIATPAGAAGRWIATGTDRVTGD